MSAKFARTMMVRIGLDVTTVANIFTQAAWTSTSPRISQSKLYKACLMFIAKHRMYLG